MRTCRKERRPKKKITSILTKTDLSTEVVPVALSTDTPAEGQIVNAVIALNKAVTINDVNVHDVKVIKAPIEKDKDNPEYVNGDYEAIATGAGKYEGDVNIKGKFGRLNP